MNAARAETRMVRQQQCLCGSPCLNSVDRQFARQDSANPVDLQDLICQRLVRLDLRLSVSVPFEKPPAKLGDALGRTHDDQLRDATPPR